ncbi:MAG: carbohydrate binding family 9 domain-containing protein [Cyclobacteriaceae bacterium]|nr:carbohydrate binding family 9 domain-containing protein [Cyclobacteriaceae bacterium]
MLKIVLGLCAVYLLTAGTVVFAQKVNSHFQLHIKKASSPIRIDGVMDEAAWEEAEVASDFYMVLPMDTSKAEVRTDVRMTYDDHNLYLMATCFHKVPGRFIVESLKRDFIFGNNDNFLVFIDPFDDQTNGFSFGANAAGAQWDGIMYEGSKVDLSWDNKWSSEVKGYDDRYIFEMAIPFKTIRYKKGITQWGINFSRLDLKTTEKSSWTPVPRQFPTAALAYTGTLVWDVPPPEAGSNISLIPYALGGVTRDFENNTPREYRHEFGGDAKIAVTSSLNLDLTSNPDFSQVDVDDQVTNLDRFELFFPEKRQFFLENGDLFANFGYENIRPFFSRRIGLGVPIRFGARLSGKINADWRIGAMDMQTDAVDSVGLPSQNFAVVAIQRRVFARSNVGVFFINKESLDYEPSDHPTVSEYNRTIGVEYNLASADNIWTGKALVFKSVTPGARGRDITHAANLRYATRKWDVLWQHEYVGENFNAEVGYVPRRGYVRLNPAIMRNFFPHSGKILSHSLQVLNSTYFDSDMHQTDYRNEVSYTATFRSRSMMSAWASPNYVKLLAPFDPTNTGGDTLATGTEYRWMEYGLEYVSKPQSLLTYAATVQAGGFFNGERIRVTAEAAYRFQPYVRIGISSTYNHIILPEPMESRELWLVGPRLDVTMTNKLFFTAFAQYNEQMDNFNLNTRFQWRYRPASDFFIVYTDNYFPGGLARNRSLVIKLTYWWNI